MKNILILALFGLIFTTGCSQSGDSGGGGGGAPAPEVCTDQNAVRNERGNLGYALPCVCPTNYTVSADGKVCNVSNTGGGNNSGGSGNTVAAPSAFSYIVGGILNINVNVNMTPRAPTITCPGGSCTYALVGNTPLPSGLNLNPTSGVISGLPGTVQTRAVTIRASNAGGSTDTNLTIRVNHLAPAGLQILNLAVGNLYRVGTTISPIPVSYSSGDGSITSMSISPALPTGLSLDITNNSPMSWAIRGTPSVSSAIQSYTITAMGPSGSATVSFSLGTAVAPTSFSYNITGRSDCSMDGGVPLCVFNQYQGFTTIPAVVNGDNLSFEVVSGGQGVIPSNSLPSGIYTSTTDGSIYTTSMGAMEATPACTAGGSQTCLYTIRAFNSLGSVNTQIKIKINGPAAPTGFSYAGSPYTFRTLTSIGQINPSWNENKNPDCTQQAGCYTVTPALPQGLSISALTGRLEGAPDKISIQAPQVYTIRANDSRGAITTTISIEVKERIPVFAYTQGGNFVFTKTVDISLAGAPTIVQDEELLCGGNAIPVNSFTISPALPAGLSLRNIPFECGVEPIMTGGAIYGTPTELSGSKVYTVTACNSGGCGTTTLNLEVSPFIVKVASGERHACAVIKETVSGTDNKVMCWGANDQSQLGYSSTDSCTDATLGTISCQKVAKLVRLGGSPLTNVVDISAGKNHTCILNSDREVYCWGDNSNGQLGNGSTSDSLTPVMAMRSSDNHIFTDASGISAGGDSSCLLGETNSSTFTDTKVENQVFCTNLATRKFVKKADPTDSVTSDQLFLAKKIAVGEGHSCAIYIQFGKSTDQDTGETEITYDTANQIKCWGDNTVGQLGDGKASGNSSTNPIIASGVVKAVDLVAGSKHSCYLRNDTYVYEGEPAPQTSTNKVYCWGDNTFGQLGFGVAGGFASVAGQVVSESGSGSISGIASISTVANASMFFKADIEATNEIESFILTSGKYALSGSPYTGSSTVTPSPIMFGVGNNLRAVEGTVGNGASTNNFACSGNLNGGVSCWGKNNVGQLGNNSAADSVIPVKVNFTPN